ncbi:MAG: sigma-70 family RNA polymerase sigma factor [Saprospiraceae bacterium]|nr:sigma-70 family RNA polymerase sigma factor [Saprospiraceae bacterium]
MQQSTYEALFREYQDRIFRLARRMLGDDALAQDVVQEVHIKCWKNRDGLAGMSNGGAWLMRVTKNLCIDKIRARKQTTELDAVAYAAPSGGPTPYQTAEVQNMMQILRKALDTLPEKQKMIFHLREIEGLQYKEIAEVLDVSVDEVKVNLFRARNKIRETLINTSNYGLSSSHTGAS